MQASALILIIVVIVGICAWFLMTPTQKAKRKWSSALATDYASTQLKYDTLSSLYSDLQEDVDEDTLKTMKKELAQVKAENMYASTTEKQDQITTLKQILELDLSTEDKIEWQKKLNALSTDVNIDTNTLKAQYDSLKTGTDYSSQIDIVNQILSDATIDIKTQQEYTEILNDLQTKQKDADQTETTQQNIASFSDEFQSAIKTAYQYMGDAMDYTKYYAGYKTLVQIMGVFKKYSDDEIAAYLASHQPTVKEQFDAAKIQEVEDTYLGVKKNKYKDEDKKLVDEINTMFQDACGFREDCANADFQALQTLAWNVLRCALEGIQYYNIKQEVYTVLTFPKIDTMKEIASKAMLYSMYLLKGADTKDAYNTIVQDYTEVQTLEDRLEIALYIQRYSSTEGDNLLVQNNTLFQGQDSKVLKLIQTLECEKKEDILTNWIQLRSAVRSLSDFKKDGDDVALYVVCHPGEGDPVPSTYEYGELKTLVELKSFSGEKDAYRGNSFYQTYYDVNDMFEYIEQYTSAPSFQSSAETMRAMWAQMVDILQNCSFVESVNFQDDVKGCLMTYLTFHAYTQVFNQSLYKEIRGILSDLEKDVEISTLEEWVKKYAETKQSAKKTNATISLDFDTLYIDSAQTDKTYHDYYEFANNSSCYLK